MDNKFNCRSKNANKTKIIIIIAVVITTFMLYNSNNINLTLKKNLIEDNDLEFGDCKRSQNTAIFPDYVDVVADKKHTDSIDCFRIANNTLRDIIEINPRPGKSIFFHETSCRSHSEGRITITARQACAVESAARLNPNLDVYLLYSSPGEIKLDCEESSLFLRQLLSYRNVHIMHMNYGSYIKNTPVENLYENGILERSHYPIAHASDILRYLTLWKYGGIYLDLDVILLKSLEKLNLNFAAVESNVAVAAGVLSFDASGEGHQWVESCLNDLKMSFTGKEWSDSSVGVITRLLKSLCAANTVKEMLKKDCRGFTVLPQTTFYSIPYPNWLWYFSNRTFEDVVEKTKTSYGIHVWNKLSSNRKINKKVPRIPYTHFAEKFCPKVFKVCDVLF